MYTAKIIKVSLSPFNDMKWIKREGNQFKNYSFGHYKIEEEEQVDFMTDLINDI